jgi:hypothetical protein
MASVRPITFRGGGCGVGGDGGDASGGGGVTGVTGDVGGVGGQCGGPRLAHRYLPTHPGTPSFEVRSTAGGLCTHSVGFASGTSALRHAAGQAKNRTSSNQRTCRMTHLPFAYPAIIETRAHPPSRPAPSTMPCGARRPVRYRVRYGPSGPVRPFTPHRGPPSSCSSLAGRGIYPTPTRHFGNGHRRSVLS